MNWILDIYWKIGALFFVISLVVHYVLVLPFLTKRGSAGFISWATNLRDGKDLEKYGEYCIKEGRPLTIYNFLSKIDKLFFVFLGGWIVLILIV